MRIRTALLAAAVALVAALGAAPAGAQPPPRTLELSYSGLLNALHLTGDVKVLALHVVEQAGRQPLRHPCRDAQLRDPQSVQAHRHPHHGRGSGRGRAAAGPHLRLLRDPQGRHRASHPAHLGAQRRGAHPAAPRVRQSAADAGPGAGRVRPGHPDVAPRLCRPAAGRSAATAGASSTACSSTSCSSGGRPPTSRRRANGRWASPRRRRATCRYVEVAGFRHKPGADTGIHSAITARFGRLGGAGGPWIAVSMKADTLLGYAKMQLDTVRVAPASL